MGAFGELAKASTTLLLPANTGDVGAMVGQVRRLQGGRADDKSCIRLIGEVLQSRVSAQAMAVYGKMAAQQQARPLATVPEEPAETFLGEAEESHKSEVNIHLD